MREKLRPLRMKIYSQLGGYRQTEVVQKEKFRRKKAQSLQRLQFKIPLMQLLLTQCAQSRDLCSKKYQILKTISAIVRQMITKASEMSSKVKILNKSDLVSSNLVKQLAEHIMKTGSAHKRGLPPLRCSKGPTVGI